MSMEIGHGLAEDHAFRGHQKRPQSDPQIPGHSFPDSTDDLERENVSRIVQPAQDACWHSRRFRRFQHSRADRFSPNTRAFPALTCATTFGTTLALEGVAMFRIDCEAVMWKITTRGFTLEEVLIMAAMNLLTSADTAAKRKNRTLRKSKGDQACD